MFVNLIEIVSRDNLSLNATGYYKLHFQADFLRLQRIVINERRASEWPAACGRLLIGIRQMRQRGWLSDNEEKSNNSILFQWEWRIWPKNEEEMAKIIFE